MCALCKYGWMNQVNVCLNDRECVKALFLSVSEYEYVCECEYKYVCACGYKYMFVCMKMSMFVSVNMSICL